MQDNKLQAGQDEPFIAFGYMTHFMGYQATDSFKISFGQVHPEGLVDALYGGVATDTVGPVAKTKDVAVVFCNVKLVFDFSNDLLEHVLDGDKAGNTSEFVYDDGQVIAVATKLTQQVIQPLAFGHKGSGPQQGANVQLRRALQFEQVLGHEDAQNIFFFTFVDRKA